MSNVIRPELINVNSLRNFGLSLNHPYHMVPDYESLYNQGKNLTELGKKTGAEVVTRSGTFSEAMLGALDQVSSYQQFASDLAEAAIVDPDAIDVHDLTIAQAEASLALNITRTILNRVVQTWRDIINTR